MNVKVFLLAGGIGGVLAASASAAVSYTTPGAVYSQNFNSLPLSPENQNIEDDGMMWQDDTTPTANIISIPGWYLYHPIEQDEGGTNGHQRFRINNGGSGTGSFYNMKGGIDSSLGMISSTTMAAEGAESWYGARFTNDTGQTLVEFTLSYAGEQWRQDGEAAGSTAQSTTFDYSLDATTIQDDAATWVDVASLGFTSPQFGSTSNVAHNGNDPANRVLVSDTVTGLNWAPGTDLWIRWSDVNEVNDAGGDHALSLDDLSFSAAVPEPSGLALLGLGGIGLLARRRKA